jgi:CDP-paratose 2-epimerase
VIEAILVTGGAGFIGSNLVNSLLRDGHDVTIFDTLSRRGSERNMTWLRSRYGHSQLHCIQGDVRNFEAVQAAVREADVIYHLAGQVAVTSSVIHPRSDFEINALGTLNVLEAARLSGRQPIIIFTSTNKV